MIYFEKITQLESDIISNGKKIGTLDLVPNSYYLVEIDYVPFQIPVKDKRLVKGIIERVYKSGLKYEARKRRLTQKFIEKSKQPKTILS
tara:strand:+ start:315 stop:581 length:267 start_codon:yes stop_codon:yes gene_type:complete